MPGAGENSPLPGHGERGGGAGNVLAQKLRRLAAPLLALALVASAAAQPAPEPPGGWRSGLAPVHATRDLAVAAHPLAARAGRDILRAGGSAVDAAVAMQLVLNVVEPQSSGIGGGAFLLHWDGVQVQAYDGRETAPAADGEELFLDPQGRPLAFYDAVVGGRSVGVPGVLRMLELAHREHGRLPWARLFQPAIHLAQDGFPVSPRLHALLREDRWLRTDDHARALFYRADGSPLPVGSRLRNPTLAATLRAIAAGGADAFYRGTIARDLVAAVGRSPHPGAMAPADLAGYAAHERPALCTDYKRWRVCGMPPPSSGGVALAQILGMLRVRNIAVVPPTAIDGGLLPQADAVHLLTEVERLAYADRGQYLADPDFVAVDTAALTDPAYLAARAARISDRSMGQAAPGSPPGVALELAPDRSPPRTATSHLSVVDRWGQALALTTSIEDAFGARRMVDGFLLNNQLTDFSFAPRGQREDGSVDPGAAPVANRVQPGKRPRSSMAPTLVFERDSGRLVAALGSPGGSLIIGFVAATLVGLLDWQLDVQAAIDLPHFASRNGPTELEDGRFPPALAAALRERGHQVAELPMTSGLQAIVRSPSGGWLGAADPRREGAAFGD